MSKLYYTRPKMQVHMGSDGVPYRTIYQGYGSYDVVSDSRTQEEAGTEGCIVYDVDLQEVLGEGTDTFVDVPGALYHDGIWSVRSLMAITGVPGDAAPVVCTPMHDMRRTSTGALRQTIGIDIPGVPEAQRHFEVGGTGPGYDDEAWTFGLEPGESDDAGAITPPVMRYNKTAKGDVVSDPDWSSIKSKFTLPANPMFSLGLWRGQPFSDSEESRALLGAYNMFVRFGETADGEYYLNIPYDPDGSMRLFWKSKKYTNGRYVELYCESYTPLPQSTVADKSALPGKPQYLWITCTYKGIVVSNNGFQNATFFYYPGMYSTPREVFAHPGVPPGRLTVGSNGGMWGVSFVPIIMPREGWFQTPVRSLPYPHSANTAPLLPIGFRAPVRDYDEDTETWYGAETYPGSGVIAEPIIEDITGKVDQTIYGKTVHTRATDPNGTHYEYLLRVPSCKTICYTDDGMAFVEMWRSAQVFDLRIAKWSVVEDKTDSITFVPIVADTLSADKSMTDVSASGSIVLDNNPRSQDPQAISNMIANWQPRRVIVLGTWETVEEEVIPEEDDDDGNGGG